jgi:uncharacterized membrane protein YcgQ (UPF0703/DUF1980 family)
MEKDGNNFPPNNKLVQEPEGNEKNRSPDPNSNETKINYDRKSNKAHKNTVKEEILQLINENFVEMILDMVNQNVQETLKNFQDKKIENLRKHKNK